MVLFSLDRVSVQINDSQLLKEIKVEIPENQITIILGPSGGGKTTFLKTLVKLLNYTGTIRYRGNEITNLQVNEYRNEVVYLGQTPYMIPGTVRENISWANNQVNVESMLSQVGLEGKYLEQEAETLSVGQKQRVQLARGLALNPKVLLLDEPSSALDAISKEGLIELVESIRALGISIIMITHDISDAKRIADYLIILNEGRVILSGEAAEVLQKLHSLSEADTLRELIRGTSP
ncbi:MAG: ATP-binding cassette domain-containing protein [Candidatus Heimdallarchaeota archaeon]|nr:ATP-binding cassette domain-containing protein [Candidatus Heimdallarchaeota archaeon]